MTEKRDAMIADLRATIKKGEHKIWESEDEFYNVLHPPGGRPMWSDTSAALSTRDLLESGNKLLRAGIEDLTAALEISEKWIRANYRPRKADQ